MLVARHEELPASLAVPQESDHFLPKHIENDIDREKPKPIATVERTSSSSHDRFLKEYGDYHAEERRRLNEPYDEIETSSTESRAGTRLEKKKQLGIASPPVTTHPLFPPLPSYGPPSTLSMLQCLLFRAISFVLSLLFVGLIVAATLIGIVRNHFSNIRLRLNGRIPRPRRFHAEEQARERDRKEAARRWRRRQAKKDVEEEALDEFPQLEGGRDPIVSDVAYYARRVGLDVETVKVQTEDGFIITLWHVYNPQEYVPLPPQERCYHGPEVLTGQKNPRTSARPSNRYPVLLMHGLLQSSGAYCTNDDDSLAFYLCKSGYDVWLGNNRCAIEPEHTTLLPSDPRMWAWNIRHLGVLDLAALVSRVLYETGFEKLGLVCHSQGTTQALVALAKEQRPGLGQHLSVFCGLAPAAYAGPLLERSYLRFMRNISSTAFRLVFGIHAFIPFMMTVRKVMHPAAYGALGYHVFSYLFGWSDARWDRGLRNRMFQFAPVYVSAETIRWWLGPECFATQKCILSTHQTSVEEAEEDHRFERGLHDEQGRSDTAWFGPHAPPFALWVPGSDNLVDGRRLLRRLQNGREPHACVVHAKVIEEYEHLDVLWAIDAVEQVGQEVRQVLWATAPKDARAKCRTPRGVISTSR